ncbi:MAG: hypothetical protein FJ271_19460 [Planctomycetes bacterium]|nr:hypothetical protein [Planctomycetota bacterium]
MAKKIITTGTPARRIETSGKPQRRIEHEEFAAALGAEPMSEAHSPNLDPMSLAALGSELLKRLRSSGGRPALADATEICRVPLSAEDVKTLEGMVAQVGESSGARPSVGQLVSVIVRAHLQSLEAAADSAREADAKPTEPDQPISKAALQQLVEEQIRPLREQVRRLEALTNSQATLFDNKSMLT